MKQMKKFVTRSAYFVLLIAIIFLSLDLASYFFLSDEVLKFDQTQKSAGILGAYSNPEIVIAGDSRAERQIIPQIIEEHTGKNTINLATAATNIQSTINTIEKNELNKNTLLIISISASAINDGLFSDIRNTIVPSSVAGLNPFDKIRLLKGLYFNNLFRTYCVLIQEKLMGNLSFDEQRMATKGYMQCGGALSDSSKVIRWEEHPWYASPKTDGITHQTFLEGLKKIDQWESEVYILNCPVPPLWYENYSGTPIDMVEKEYSSILKNFCDKSDNMHFIDYYNNPLDTLQNKHFYNMQHLNHAGANIFTDTLITTIMNISESI